MSLSKKAVLIIEDEAAICMYMEEVFKGEGFPVLTAENGRLALELLHRQQTLPGLIFLDLMMPVMDGHRFIHELQENPENARFKDIPIVVVTASQMNVRGNVVTVLRKPVDLQQLCDFAEKYATMSVG
ncbi:MAG: response regulator [Bdellovibrionales bacterium]|nr:response regulator [Bdellovibrionales bacterium]